MMYRMLMLLACCTATLPAADPAPLKIPKDPPRGYEIYTAPKTTAKALVSTGRAGTSDELLKAAIEDTARWFDKPILTGKPEADPKTSRLIAPFRGKLGGEPVGGIIIISTFKKTGDIAILCDRRPDFAKSFPALRAAVIGFNPQFLGANFRCFETTLPDGSGKLNLPLGWKITAANLGAVDAAGPDGQSASFGAAFPVVTPAGNRGPLGPLNNPLVAEYAEPVAALKTLFPQISRMSVALGQPAMTNLNIVDSAPLEYQNGKAANILWEYDKSINGKPVKHRSINTIITAPVGPAGWMFYTSGVTAPQKSFDANFPTMVNIWMSWQIDQRTLWQRRKLAMESMTKAMDLLNEAAVDQAITASWGTENFIMTYIRETKEDE